LDVISTTHNYFDNYKNELVSELAIELGQKIIFKNKKQKTCPIKSCTLFN
jgi:hypothetical protein